ncbi:hypothetical protein V866_001972 [Kwoniella sp. B9012]
MPNPYQSHPSRIVFNHTPSTLSSPSSEASSCKRPRLNISTDAESSESGGRRHRTGNTPVTDNTITESHTGHRESENEDDDWVDWDIFSGSDKSWEDTGGLDIERTGHANSGDSIDEERTEEYEVRAREKGRKEMEMIEVITSKQQRTVNHVDDKEGNNERRPKSDPFKDGNHGKNRTSTKKPVGRAYPRPLPAAVIEARKRYAELMKEKKERAKKN